MTSFAYKPQKQNLLPNFLMRHFTKSIPREFFKIGGKLNREERFRWINATGDDGEMCLCFSVSQAKDAATRQKHHRKSLHHLPLRGVYFRVRGIYGGNLEELGEAIGRLPRRFTL